MPQRSLRYMDGRGIALGVRYPNCYKSLYRLRLCYRILQKEKLYRKEGIMLEEHLISDNVYFERGHPLCI
jgi:hypothetical protein